MPNPVIRLSAAHRIIASLDCAYSLRDRSLSEKIIFNL
jgi:hypothetical protein